MEISISWTLFKDFSKINKITPIKIHGLKKGEHIGCIPPDGREDIFDPFLFTKMEYLRRETLSDSLTHEFWVHT